MSVYKQDYFYEQVKAQKIDAIVIGSDRLEVLENEELVPILVEGNLYLEFRRENKVISVISFWKIDEVHYVESECDTGL